MQGFITIVFNDEGQAEFDIKTSEDSQILTAILGLEGYIGSKTGLEPFDIREILDEMKGDVNVVPQAINDGIVDAEVEEPKIDLQSSDVDGSEESH